MPEDSGSDAMPSVRGRNGIRSSPKRGEEPSEEAVASTGVVANGRHGTDGHRSCGSALLAHRCGVGAARDHGDFGTSERLSSGKPEGGVCTPVHDHGIGSGGSNEFAERIGAQELKVVDPRAADYEAHPTVADLGEESIDG